jgi:hypothetical protein
MPTTVNFLYHKQMKYESVTNEARVIDFVKSAFIYSATTVTSSYSFSWPQVSTNNKTTKTTLQEQGTSTYFIKKSIL